MEAAWVDAIGTWALVAIALAASLGSLWAWRWNRGHARRLTITQEALHYRSKKTRELLVNVRLENVSKRRIHLDYASTCAALPGNEDYSFTREELGYHLDPGESFSWRWRRTVPAEWKAAELIVEFPAQDPGPGFSGGGPVVWRDEKYYVFEEERFT